MFDLGTLDDWQQARFIYLLALIGVVLASLLSFRSIGFFRTVGMLTTWAAIFIAVTWFASGPEEVRRLTSRLTEKVDPATPRAEGQEVRIRARPDGHFWVRARVNGEPVVFLVDTGATDIAITDETAARIGIDLDDLRFDRVAVTANGLVRGASIRLDTVELGPIRRTNVAASVTEGALGINLLGMTFLRTLSGWRVEGDTLILQA